MKKTFFAIALASTSSFAGAAEWIVPDLAVGGGSLEQSVSSNHIADGVVFYKITRGKSNNEEYLISSGVLSAGNVGAYTHALDQMSIKSTVEPAPETAPNGKSIGKIVRVRGFSSEKKAESLAKTLERKELNFSVRYSAQDGYETDGPFNISLLRVDLNKYKGKVKSVLANDKIPTAETVTSMAERSNALAAINGGFFAFNGEVGDNGAPAGIYVKNGELLREAANNRPVLIIDNSDRQSKVSIGSSVITEVSLVNKKNHIRIDGLNRKPGIILNCGGYGDIPSIEAIHDFVCTDSSEIIVYTKAYGKVSPSGDGVEIVINKANKIVRINNHRGSKIKAGNQYIQLTGDSKLPYKIGDIVNVDANVLVDGVEVDLKAGVSMINAGPSLVTNFKIDKASRNTQGFNPYPHIGGYSGSQDDDGLGVNRAMENREGFYNGWVLRRHPRTALGVTEDNVVYAAVVYGRQPTVTEGANITDMAKIMNSLSVKDAINLDGGGSSMMVADGKRTGNSSDGSERPVSDAIIFTR